MYGLIKSKKFGKKIINKMKKILKLKPLIDFLRLNKGWNNGSSLKKRRNKTYSMQNLYSIELFNYNLFTFYTYI